MKMIVVGATGTIGGAVASALEAEHDVVRASRGGEPRVDLGDPASIAALFATVDDADAVVCCAASAPLPPQPSRTRTSRRSPGRCRGRRSCETGRSHDF
jgi:nucleoside-diphosphate-sugar epimerase